MTRHPRPPPRTRRRTGPSPRMEVPDAGTTRLVRGVSDHRRGGRIRRMAFLVRRPARLALRPRGRAGVPGDPGPLDLGERGAEPPGGAGALARPLRRPAERPAGAPGAAGGADPPGTLRPHPAVPAAQRLRRR